MFGKSKTATPAPESIHGWSIPQFERLESILVSSRPSFSIPLVGYAQSFGRTVMDPHNSCSENELFGTLEAFRTKVEGRIDIEPIGTVGHIAFDARGTDLEGWSPRATFQLAVLDREQEVSLQQQLHAAFAAKINPTLVLFLEPVENAQERIRELKEDGGCDELPLKSFRLITEFGRVDI